MLAVRFSQIDPDLDIEAPSGCKIVPYLLTDPREFNYEKTGGPGMRYCGGADSSADNRTGCFVRTNPRTRSARRADEFVPERSLVRSP
jgi:hypothetical protein